MSIPVAAGLVLPACKRIQGSAGSAEPSSLAMVLRGGKAFYQNRWQQIDVGIDFNGRLRFGIIGCGGKGWSG